MQSTTTTSSSAALSSISQRVAAHTHITGLGLNEYGEVDDNGNDALVSSRTSCGLVGQVQAREAMGLIADLVHVQKLAGRAALLTGPPGTGKTALAVALSKTIGTNNTVGNNKSTSSTSAGNVGVPFCRMVASDVYSKEVKKTEILATHFRKSIGIRIRERKEVYEGEVTELTVEETDDPLVNNNSNNMTSYGRTISHVVITLKTTKGTKTLKLDPILYDNLQKESVSIGDIIYIEANSGTVKRVGRSDTFATEYDLEAEEYVPIPKGDVHKKREIVQDITLHDLDVANAQPPTSNASTSRNDVLSLLSGLTNKNKKTEITDKLRQEINKIVQKYVNDGIAELIPGVLFIDEVHMLDMECFTYLNRSLESSLSPIVVMATNRGVTTITDTTILSPHGIPIDLLDRLLIIPTIPYTINEIKQIIAIRANTEKIILYDPMIIDETEIAITSDTVLTVLGQIGIQTSLRYCIQILSPAKIIAETFGRSYITISDIQNVELLFVDSKASAILLSNTTTNQGYM